MARKTVDDLEERLRGSAPRVGIEGCDAAAREVAAEVAARYRPRRKLRKRRTLVAAVAGIVLIPTAAAAAVVVHFTAETGRFGLPGFTENDTSQYINMCAPDINRYVASLEPTARLLPPGSTWSGIGARYVASFHSGCPPHGPGEITQVTGIETSLLAFSSCPWENWALAAPASSRAADLQRADGVLADIQVAEHQVNPHGTSGWQHYRQQYTHASLAFLDYDYQVNCLGRDTEANPPTVADPDQ
jgi:hypothetical protein